MDMFRRVGSVVSAATLIWGSFAFAVQPLEITDVYVDEGVIVDTEITTVFTVVGTNFENGGAVELWLGEIPLVVLTQTDNLITAKLPEGMTSVMDGSYQLVATTGGGTVRHNEFDGVTIGAIGPQGPQGEPGADGEDGAPGADGSDGAQGPKGDKGDTGDTGPTGDKGDTGLQGDKGDTGDPGLKGDPGDMGLPGLKGDTGDKGDKGDKGDTGPVGPEGSPGADGLDVTVELCALYEHLLPLGGPALPAICSVGPEPKYIFATYQSFDFTVTSLAELDQACNDGAILGVPNSGLPEGGIYQAWVSTSNPSENPAARSTRHDGPYLTLSGAFVASNWDDLTDGIETDIHRMDRDGFDFFNPSNPADSTYHVWTNTNADGTPRILDAPFCARGRGVQSPYVFGEFFDPTHWSYRDVNQEIATCDFRLPVYCIQQ